MNLRYIFIGILTFVIIFLMNYIGNDAPDKLYRALITAIASVIGLGAGMWIYNKRNKNDDRNHFD